jgi:hypothetical protein
MADNSSKTAGPKSAGPKGAGPKGKPARSDSEALIALAAEEGAKARAPAGSPDPEDLPEDLIEENRRSMEAFVQANAAVLDGMAALSAEMLTFGNKRFGANIERSQSLAGCGDAEQAFQVQTEFFESAVRQYLDQANNMMVIMSSISRSFWGPLESQSDEASEQRSGDSGSG